MGEGADNLSPATTPRLRQLQQMLQRQPDDPFLLYAAAMEHKKGGDSEQALELFGQVLERDPNYCYAYYTRAETDCGICSGRVDDCSCIGSVRDSLSGPVAMTMMIAAAISSKMKMMYAPMLPLDTVFAIGMNTPVAFDAAWNKVTSNRLPFVPLYSQVYSTDTTVVCTINQAKATVSQCVRYFGRCQIPQIKPRISAEVSAPYFACKRGRT